MKKKILALTLVVCLAVVAVAGATLAYFTDTDEANNTFTVGNVKIELIEQQRNADGTALEDFENNKMLLPIVGSAQGEKATVEGVAGLPVAQNYVDKIITVKNNNLDAYVRVYVAIPASLDNVGDAGQNILHFNTTTESSEENQWGSEVLVAQNFEINEVNYNIYYRTYNSVLGKGVATDTPAYVGFYLDKNVDHDGTNYTINGTPINYDFSNGVTIPVFAVGVQATGFVSADEAITAAFGANYNPWAN